MDAEFVFASEGMERVMELVQRAAASELPILLAGESGVGKDRIARRIHALGVRARGAFVAVNCTAIPEALLESELFGHERGSFPGAQQKSEGQLARAHGGTLFLDEIGDMPAGLQAKLLRFLREKQLRPVGGQRERSVNVRILCATHRSPAELGRGGLMRKDLYYRVSGLVIQIPPLRERPRDAVLLAKHFFARELVRAQRVLPALGAAVLELVARYPWPGNVRELENAIARGVLLCDGHELRPEHLQLPGFEPASGKGRLAIARREAVTQAWQESQGNVSQAARLLGVSRPTAYRLLRQIGER